MSRESFKVFHNHYDWWSCFALQEGCEVMRVWRARWGGGGGGQKRNIPGGWSGTRSEGGRETEEKDLVSMFPLLPLPQSPHLITAIGLVSEHYTT